MRRGAVAQKRCTSGFAWFIPSRNPPRTGSRAPRERLEGYFARRPWSSSANARHASTVVKMPTRGVDLRVVNLARLKVPRASPALYARVAIFATPQAISARNPAAGPYALASSELAFPCRLRL